MLCGSRDRNTHFQLSSSACHDVYDLGLATSCGTWEILLPEVVRDKLGKNFACDQYMSISNSKSYELISPLGNFSTSLCSCLGSVITMVLRLSYTYVSKIAYLCYTLDLLFFFFFFSNTAAARHMWLLNTWNVTVPWLWVSEITHSINLDLKFVQEPRPNNLIYHGTLYFF